MPSLLSTSALHAKPHPRNSCASERERGRECQRRSRDHERDRGSSLTRLLSDSLTGRARLQCSPAGEGDRPRRARSRSAQRTPAPCPPAAPVRSWSWSRCHRHVFLYEVGMGPEATLVRLTADWANVRFGTVVPTLALVEAPKHADLATLRKGSDQCIIRGFGRP